MADTKIQETFLVYGVDGDLLRGIACYLIDSSNDIWWPAAGRANCHVNLGGWQARVSIILCIWKKKKKKKQIWQIEKKNFFLSQAEYSIWSMRHSRPKNLFCFN